MTSIYSLESTGHLGSEWTGRAADSYIHISIFLLEIYIYWNNYSQGPFVDKVGRIKKNKRIRK